MHIVILDRAAMGHDLNFDCLFAFGEVTSYDSTCPDEASARIADAEVVVLNKVRLTEGILKAAPRLRLICVFATGYDNIDMTAAKRYGKAVCNVPAYSTESVVLFTVGTALSLFAMLPAFSAYVRSGAYTESGCPNCLSPVYREVAGKVWGIIGGGHIGTRVGEVAASLGARVLIYQRHPHPKFPTVELDTLCRESDILSVHCPLNAGTRGLIGRQELAVMKRGAVLVNEARGAVLDEEAVADAVSDGRLGGFGCDVYSEEPFGKTHPYTKILDRKNVLLTPHAAWAAVEARERCLGVIRDNIDAYIRGEKKNRVDI